MHLWSLGATLETPRVLQTIRLLQGQQTEQQPEARVAICARICMFWEGSEIVPDSAKTAIKNIKCHQFNVISRLQIDLPALKIDL